jgi:membrane-associated protease RseP (regulator of RpoE activity)
MFPRLTLLLAGFVLAGVQSTIGAVDELRHIEKGTYLGILFGPRTAANAIPSAKAASRQAIPPGVVITHVLPNSPAEAARLQRGDLLLRYDHTTVRDAEHLAQMIRADKPDHKISLVIQRNQRLRLVDVTLALGPVLKPAPAVVVNARPTTSTLSVWAAPLDSGKIRLTIEYQPIGGQKKVTTCEGVASDLASAVEKLPQRERNLVRIALQRLNTLNQTKPGSGDKR